jgi:hypothetical protein
MWISNTATTAMMFPIGLSIVAHLTQGKEAERGSREFATAMMLMAAFGASIGGIGTPIGTPPNLIGIGMLSRIAHVETSFFNWMLFGVPIVVLLFAFLVTYFYFRTLRGLVLDTGRADRIKEELRRLGPLSPGQRNVLIAFSITVALWLTPGVLAIAGAGSSAFAKGYAVAVPESVAAMTGAILLFLLPVSWRARRFTLTWEEAVRIDWGIILLFGGGLVMGDHVMAAGFVDALADRPLHGGRHRHVGSGVEHRVGQHGGPDRDCGGARSRCQPASARPRRDARGVDGIHDAHLHAAERHRLQLRVRSDHRDDEAWRRAGRSRLRGDCHSGWSSRMGSVTGWKKLQRSRSASVALFTTCR